ncbi:dihydrodipicolinate synthase family protein [Mesorhizobium sanjuanii]|uniref:dihydrodipicolinate synthase family protein n=1 Tax=Mesorhizobium sanjuanii TaxID=2037900 RepID=UPI0013FDCD67|nr:dihydrodipicolinate synthase family protein [Mesorhizobium sanjuanii]
MAHPLSLKGIIPAFPTPIRPDHSVDIEGVRRLVRYMIDNGASGVVPLGGTGEFTALSAKARIETVGASVAAAAGKVPVVAGVLSPGLGDAVDTGKSFKEAGADALMLIVPFYTRNSQEGVLRYFAEVREAVDLPIVLYDNPARTHFVIAPETIATMAKRDIIIGMKASNTDLYHFDHVMQKVPATFQMLSGQDTLFTQQVSMGARGGILTSAVLVPSFWNEVQVHAKGGRFDDALALQRRLCPLMDALFSEENPGPTRLALGMIGLDPGGSLPPLGAVSEGLGTRLLGILRELHSAGTLPVKPVASSPATLSPAAAS